MDQKYGMLCSKVNQLGQSFNNPILIQAPPREANQELEEIWEENEDEYGWTDFGYFTDENSYLV